jgi:hypothetical protein
VILSESQADQQTRTCFTYLSAFEKVNNFVAMMLLGDGCEIQVGSARQRKSLSALANSDTPNSSLFLIL